MIPVSEAERIVEESLGLFPAVTCNLCEAAGRVLREPVLADRESPPFNRATVDGYALNTGSVSNPGTLLPVDGTISAGEPPLPTPETGHCVEIMTGAVVPDGCDAVVRLEDVSVTSERVRLLPEVSVSSGDGIHAKASDFAAGTNLLEPGICLGSREIGVIASCGRETLSVASEPLIGILTTGNELVDVEDIPKPYQIRRSNDVALQAGFRQAGYTRTELTHVPDDRESIRWQLEGMLQKCQVVVTCGGASKGKSDFIPGLLEEIGVVEKFHGVRQRPGKPMGFGVLPAVQNPLTEQETPAVPVFALPGNPVSALVCLHRYVLPALRQLSGMPVPSEEYVILTEEVRVGNRLTHFIPVTVRTDRDGRVLARPSQPNTSGDFASLLGTSGFVELPEGESVFAIGYVARFFAWT